MKAKETAFMSSGMPCGQLIPDEKGEQSFLVLPFLPEKCLLCL